MKSRDSDQYKYLSKLGVVTAKDSVEKVIALFGLPIEETFSGSGHSLTYIVDNHKVTVVFKNNEAQAVFQENIGKISLNG